MRRNKLCGINAAAVLAPSLAMCLLSSVIASAASAKTLVLYEEGTPVPNGAKLDVEVQGFCGFSWEPKEWNFPAQMTANDSMPVVVTAEPPGMASCSYNSTHPAEVRAELKEIELSASGTSIVGVFRSFGWTERGTCENEFHNATGHAPHAKREVKVKAVSVGEAVSGPCRRGRPLRAKIELILRGSNGNVLQARYT